MTFYSDDHEDRLRASTALLLLLSATLFAMGCGGEESGPDSNREADASIDTTETIGDSASIDGADGTDGSRSTDSLDTGKENETTSEPVMRFVNVATGAEALDLFEAPSTRLTRLDYLDATEYVSLSGRQMIDVYVEDQTPAEQNPLLEIDTTTDRFEPGKTYTAFIGQTGQNQDAELTIKIVEDQFRDAPNPGNFAGRFLHSASQFGSVDINIGGARGPGGVNGPSLDWNDLSSPEGDLLPTDGGRIVLYPEGDQTSAPLTSFSYPNRVVTEQSELYLVLVGHRNVPDTHRESLGLLLVPRDTRHKDPVLLRRDPVIQFLHASPDLSTSTPVFETPPLRLDRPDRELDELEYGQLSAPLQLSVQQLSDLNLSIEPESTTGVPTKLPIRANDVDIFRGARYLFVIQGLFNPSTTDPKSNSLEVGVFPGYLYQQTSTREGTLVRAMHAVPDLEQSATLGKFDAEGDFLAMSDLSDINYGEYTQRTHLAEPGQVTLGLEIDVRTLFFEPIKFEKGAEYLFIATGETAPERTEKPLEMMQLDFKEFPIDRAHRVKVTSE